MKPHPLRPEVLGLLTSMGLTADDYWKAETELEMLEDHARHCATCAALLRRMGFSNAELLASDCLGRFIVESMQQWSRLRSLTKLNW